MTYGGKDREVCRMTSLDATYEWKVTDRETGAIVARGWAETQGQAVSLAAMARDKARADADADALRAGKGG